ncbi:MAG: hypothetical protein Tsb002_12030 [Wenzhouxiangellaceae bacterium]
MDRKESAHWENQETWMRLLYMLVIGLCYWFSQFVTGILALLQFGFVLFTGERNSPLLDFSARLAVYIKQMVDFLYFNTEDKPFPFREFPEQAQTTGEETESAAETTAANTDNSEKTTTADSAKPGAGKKRSSKKKTQRKTSKKKTASRKVSTDSDNDSGGDNDQERST